MPAATSSGTSVKEYDEEACLAEATHREDEQRQLLEDFGRRLAVLEQWQLQKSAATPMSPSGLCQPSPEAASPGRVTPVSPTSRKSGADSADAISKPFSRMWVESKLHQKEMFDQDLLQSIYEKSFQRARNKAAVFGGGFMGIMSMPFGPIGMVAGAGVGAMAGGLIGTCLDKRREIKNIHQSELEKRRLRSLVRWSAERFADEDDPVAAVKHLEMVVMEFKPIADIAQGSKNARKTLKLLDSWAARKSMMRQIWFYMDNVLINWKTFTRSDFLRAMTVMQTLVVMYHFSTRVLDDEEENFILRVERLLEHESVRYVMSRHELMSNNQDADIIMESMIFADNAGRPRSGSRGNMTPIRAESPTVLEKAEEDSDEEAVETYASSKGGLLLSPISPKRPDDCLSEGGRSIKSNASSQRQQATVTRRVLKPPFFKSWEDFCEFENGFKHRIPITQSDFTLLLEKEAQDLTGWDLCIDRKEIRVAKTLSSDGSGCIFLRAWSTLPGVELHVAFHMFYNCENRMQWDRAFYQMEVLDNIQGSDILYSVLRIPAFTARDYVQYRRVKVLEDGSILISLRSADHEKAPEHPGNVRAESYISGYVLRPYQEGSEKGIKLFLMTSTDIKGVIPKWIINWVAPKKPGEWIDCLKRACLDYQASHPDTSALKQQLEPFMAENPFDYEDVQALVDQDPVSPLTPSTRMASCSL
eukprot:TRINITY_DN3747_c0_g1_i1.p1 TRINITY_DN3747_c0_g1~~TRINITY_DN3747_c0_g1_i1.p1  ORF type:complete len:701 (+),score=129.93 TRINITY_DN3747_c0_g1_i1:236-2338(+)